MLLPTILAAQSASDDESTVQEAVEWLNTKLNYTYHDGHAQKWWINKFYVNEQKEVTIKNTLTGNPRSASIREKTFHTRTFKLQDINPYQIKISEIEKDQGRIVKGKLIDMRTFGRKRNIHHKINDRAGTDVSFVQISLPTFLIDSIADYAESVQAKLQEAIIASTRVYASENIQENKVKIFETMSGSFMNDEGDEIQTTPKFENVISLSSNDSENYFVYSPADNLFYLTSISNEGVMSKKYQLATGDRIILQNVENAEDVIGLETANSFTFSGKLFYRK